MKKCLPIQKIMDGIILLWIVMDCYRWNYIIINKIKLFQIVFDFILLNISKRTFILHKEEGSTRSIIKASNSYHIQY